ncbi:endoribonuclease Dcr-2 [Euwallacea similis]|uniref:endoribonuclease Dcr-2 n=1 Tax=Euwallacea similis TaxID=1736056 RepID=UPI00344EEF37
MVSETEEADFLPRDYQVALTEIALKNNSVIYLPTGAGKTFIAILVLKQLQHSLKKYTDGGKISFVVVNTVALVDQHAKCIERRTNLSVGRYSGDMSLDFWPKTQWYQEFDKFQVLVMTVQILVNLTNQRYLDLNKVNLIVFDECHRGVSDQPMRQICKSLADVCHKPRILGLTATLLNGNCKPQNVLNEVRNLEITYHSKVATVEGLAQVSGFSTNPREFVKTYQKHTLSAIEKKAHLILEQSLLVLKAVKEDAPMVQRRSNIELKPLSKDEGFKKLRNILKDVQYHIELFGIFGGSKAVLAHMIQLERLKIHCDNSILHEVLCYAQTTLCWIKAMFQSVMEKFSVEVNLFKFSSNKVLELITIFNDYKQDPRSKELCALIFTKRRFTAKVLYYILSDLSASVENYSYIKPNFMVGYNSNPYNDTRESLYTAKKNREVLQMFESKENNVLCASNVLEEGVDISTCSLVIKFDHPEEYRSYIQSKGRARHPDSFYYMMVENTEIEKFTSRYQEFQLVERELQRLLIGQNGLRADPTQQEINEMYQEDKIPPYYANGPGSAKVDMVSAISLLSQYCNSLPCDKYTVMAPEWYSERKFPIGDKETPMRVVIVLPTMCPITDPIMGQFMSNLKMAKRAAALLACKRLHQIGELDDHLLPRRYVVPDKDVNFLFPHYPEEKESLAGTNKNKRIHQKQIPSFLRGPIKPQKSFWLHIIHLSPVFERREELNYSTFYDMYVSNLCYGLITPHRVPTICDFPIYVSMGTLNVSLKVNVLTGELSEADLLDIKQFNVLVLKDILRCLREFVMFDNGHNAETMLLVPVNQQLGTIDFKVLKEHKTVKEPFRELTSDERLNLNVTQEEYLRKIVSPWYKDQGDYLVTEVTLRKSAMSQFPNEQFGSYEDYYNNKHSIRLLNASQPLLYVKHLTKKMNFIKPQGAQAKKKREKSYEDLEIHLIPELVVKQDFPAALWIQANLLPTLVSRFSFLFRLEEFRVKLAKEMSMGDVTEKQPLKLDQYLLNYEPHLEKTAPINVLVAERKENILSPPISYININKDYVKKMLEQEFPWKDTEEPKDIERDLDVTIVDIDYYESFLCKVVNEDESRLKNDVPIKQKDQLALTYFNNYEEKPIRLIAESDLSKGPDLYLIYKAMTTAKANDIVNMERLETLGDSFLKLFGSLYIYLKFPSFTEGQATSLKGRLVSNKNLFYLAVNHNIGGLMKSNDLQIADWLPPGFKIPDLIEKRIEDGNTSLSSLYHLSIPIEEQISGEISQKTVNSIMELRLEENPSEEGLIQEVASLFKCNYIGDKKIADCVEALLGAYFQTCGILGGIRFIECIGIIPASENLVQLLQEPPSNPLLKPEITLLEIQFHIPNWQDIENKVLCYTFKNRAYLLQALTHSSYSLNRLTHSYERLEFLGDAVLDFLITCHIFESRGYLDPGELTDLRSALVNNNTFGSLVIRHGLHKHLLMINAKLQGMVDRFATFIESKKFVIDDEVLILLEEADAEGLNLAEYVDVPKVLGDVFEALAGAIYLDSGKDLNVVWKVFHRLMWKEIETFSANVPKNLVRKLYEFVPNAHPKFGDSKDATQGRVMVPLQFMADGRPLQVYGFGSNKAMAKKAAAKLALRQLCKR